MATPAPLPPDLTSLRLKLVTLIDSISSLQSLLHYHSINCPSDPSSLNPGIPSYPDLLSRYNVLLSHIVGLGGLLSEVEHSAGGGGTTRTTTSRKDKWESWTIVPGNEVEESKDWLVGLLLRTKQTPQVESHLSSLLASLPPSISTSANFNEKASEHNKHVSDCYDFILGMKEGEDGEEWSWKERLPPGPVVEEKDDDDDEEEEDDEGEKMDVTTGTGLGEGEGEKEKEKEKDEGTLGRAMSMDEVAQFLKSGRLPET